ncbi:MAG: Gfo/Idh/MocA family oxidoreductase [Paenibacillaceae bacterium]|nr:Gfo/Idh/MocA family oxidoreductase [Paenibacillaceae bacterium]
MKQVGIGVVGTGVIGRKHLQSAAASPSIRTVGTTDLREDQARDAAALYGADKVYATADEMFADPEVEAVVLAVPAAGKTELALKAIAAGKHALIEKPAGMNAREVQQLIDAQKAHPSLIVGCCSSRFRYYESGGLLRRRIASGELGELRMLRTRGVWPAGKAPETAPPFWRLNKSVNGGGIMMNWGSYDLDYMLGLTGWRLKPVRVLAQTWQVAPHLNARVAPESDAETHVTAFISCEGGETIVLERGEFTSASRDETSEIIGTHGSLLFRMMPGEGKKIVYNETNPLDGVRSSVIWSGDEDFEVLHTGVLWDFADAVIHNRPPATTLEQALLIQQITDAIYLSAANGRCVEIG